MVHSIHPGGRAVALRRTLTSVALASLLASILIVAAPVKQAVAAADGDWVCTVPAGFTWDATRPDSFTCGTGALSYHLRIPANNLRACSTHAGFTWDATASDSFTCGTLSNPGRWYRLRLPADNLTACSVPDGFTWDRTASDFSACGTTGNPGRSYHLRAPADNLTACSVPDGFTWDRTASDFSACGTTGNPGRSYHLRTPVTGLWACSVPQGFTYDTSQTDVTACGTLANQGRRYLLRSLTPTSNLPPAGSATGDATSDLIMTEGDDKYAVATSNGQRLGGPGSSVWLSGWGNSSTAQVGDFNGDRKTDLIVPDTSVNTWNVALSDGARLGAPGTGVWLTSAIKMRDWSRVGDFNGDLKSDLIVTDGTSGYVVATSDGQRLGPQSVWLTGWARSSNAQVGDFNGDRKSDLIVPNPATGGWDVALSDGVRFGGPGSGPWLTGWTTSPQWSRVGDFNGDGKSDLIVHEGGDRFAVAISDGSRLVGAPGSSVWLTGWASNANAQVGDFNGDGKSDLILPNTANGAWHVALSNGTQLGAFGSGPWLAGWPTNPGWARAM